MIPKSGYRFSEKIMLKQKDRAGWRLEEKSSRSIVDLPSECARRGTMLRFNPRNAARSAGNSRMTLHQVSGRV
jgi:hypothetical protein